GPGMPGPYMRPKRPTLRTRRGRRIARRGRVAVRAHALRALDAARIDARDDVVPVAPVADVVGVRERRGPARVARAAAGRRIDAVAEPRVDAPTRHAIRGSARDRRPRDDERAAG